MTRVVCVDAAWDEPTKATSVFRTSEVYPHGSAHDLVYLHGTDAVRQHVRAAVIPNGIGLISGSGHGTPVSFTGHEMSVLWRVGEYEPGEVRGKVVHLLACYAARRLGPDMVRAGARAFVGYDTEFVFTRALAEVFLACDAQIDLALFEGKTVAEAHQAAYEAFDAARANAETPDIEALFESNRDHLRSPVTDAQFGVCDARIDGV